MKKSPSSNVNSCSVSQSGKSLHLWKLKVHYQSQLCVKWIKCSPLHTVSSTTTFNNSFPSTPSELFISGFLTKISWMLHTAHPSCPSWFDHNVCVCVCVCVCAEYRIWSSLWNSFVRPSITSSLLGSHIFLCTLFP